MPRWKTGETYTAGQQVISPNGDVVSAIANHTSVASFNTDNWAYVRMSDYFVSVKAYGAKGDGIADDTTPVMNANTAANAKGAVTFFPDGTYKVTAPVEDFHKAHLVAGATMTAGTPGMAAVVRT